MNIRLRSITLRLRTLYNTFRGTRKQQQQQSSHHKWFSFVKKLSSNTSPRSIARGTSLKMKPKPRTLLKTCEYIGHKVLVFIVRLFLRFRHGNHGATMPPIKDLILLESATSLAHKIRTKKITSVAVTKSFIARIKEINAQLNCVVDQRFEEALREAAAADKQVAESTSEQELARLTPFLGVPISTKDCIAVKGLLHTAGLYNRRHIRSAEDAVAMALMRKAGAIPFALTNVSECCMWWESSNTVHGRTSNPYDANRIVGGSSGGEGCIQGAAGSPFGLGSDIGGSIRMPAFFNGVFGHKPSKNIVSNEGQYPIPLTNTQNEFLGLGPMSRFATDLSPMLAIMADKNAAQLRLDEPVDVKRIRVYYQESDGGAHMVSPVDPDIRVAMTKVVRHLERIGVNVQRVQLEQFRDSAPIWLAAMKVKEAHGFDEQLANLDGRINARLEMAKWFVGRSNHTFIGLLTALFEKAGVQYGTPKHTYMTQKRDVLLKELETLLAGDAVFLYPTHPTVAPYHNEPLARVLNFSYTAIINVLGLPATAVPLGLGSEGLPLGIQVVGALNQDRLCLAVACELERAFGGWVPPKIEA